MITRNTLTCTKTKKSHLNLIIFIKIISVRLNYEWTDYPELIRRWPVQLDVLTIGKPAKTLFTNIFRLVKIFEFLHWISLHILNESQNKSWFTSYGWFYFYNGEDHRFSRIRVVEKLLILVQSFCLVLLWLRVDRPSPFF